MIVYHGSNQVIENPDVSYSKKYLDFGKGFYVTTFQHQAEKWATRKSIRFGGEPVVNVYELKDDISQFKMLSFDNENEKWLDFVCACRKGEDLNNSYDIISGNVANDDVFKTVDMYFRGIWDKNRTIKELRYYKTNNQICIAKQEVLKHILSFKSSYKVEKNDRS